MGSSDEGSGAGRDGSGEEIPARAVLDDMSEMIVRWRPGGVRTFVNGAYCRLFGQSREEILGTSFFPLIAEVDRPTVAARFARLTPEAPVTTGRHRAVARDGGLVWMEWTDRAIFDEEGVVVEYQSVGRDITELVAREERIRELERADAVAKTSAAVAHDLAGVFQVITLSIPDDATSVEQRAIADAVRHGRALLRQLRELSYGRATARVRVDLREAVASSESYLRELAGPRIAVEMDLPTEPLWVDADPTQLDQVLLNLVRNAIEAIGARGDGRGRVAVEVGRTAGRSVRLKVRDDAGGIPAAVLPRIFDPHVTTKHGGDGLGLATVKAIVDGHDAAIEVRSDTDGTLFEITFSGASLDRAAAPSTASS